MRTLRFAFALVAMLGLGFAGACTSPTGPDCQGDQACYDLGSGGYDLGSGGYDLGSGG